MSDWQAGRELDAEIARRVFGHRVIPAYPNDEYGWRYITGQPYCQYPASSEEAAWKLTFWYSTDLKYAWEIIRYFDHGVIAGAAPLEQRIAFWQELARIVEWERNTTWPEALALSDLPLLICRAALVASEPSP